MSSSYIDCPIPKDTFDSMMSDGEKPMSCKPLAIIILKTVLMLTNGPS